MTDTVEQKPIFLERGQGRAYDMGRIKANFKADGDEMPKIVDWFREHPPEDAV